MKEICLVCQSKETEAIEPQTIWSGLKGFDDNKCISHQYTDEFISKLPWVTRERKVGSRKVCAKMREYVVNRYCHKCNTQFAQSDSPIERSHGYAAAKEKYRMKDDVLVEMGCM